jgi:hypothetical protein
MALGGRMDYPVRIQEKPADYFARFPLKSDPLMSYPG